MPRLQQSLHAVQNPNPAVLDVLPRQWALLEVAVDEPYSSEPFAGAFDGPFHSAWRFMFELGVVAGVPGLHKATRTSRCRPLHLLDDAVDGRAPVDTNREIWPSLLRWLDERRRVEIASSPLRLSDRRPYLLGCSGDVDLVDVRSEAHSALPRLFWLLIGEHLVIQCHQRTGESGRVLADPPVGHLLDGHWVEVVPFRPSLPCGSHEIALRKDGEVLHHPEAGHLGKLVA